MVSRATRRTAWHRLPHLAASAAAVVLLLGTGAPRPAHAQGSGNGFLFKAPIGSIALRGGYARATAGSDLFSFVTRDLTLDRGSFSGPTAQADLAITVAPRLDVVLGAGYAGTTGSSEYRELVDQNNQPIQQTTSFQRVPVTATLRMYLTQRGRSVGNFAWVPARLAPYVGVGGGAMYYRFRQQGDFVNPANNNVFTGNFSSSAWAPEAQGMIGVDYSLTPRITLTGETKYVWARGTLSDSFSGFDRIDLSGLNTTLGLSVRF